VNIENDQPTPTPAPPDPTLPISDPPNPTDNIPNPLLDPVVIARQHCLDNVNKKQAFWSKQLEFFNTNPLIAIMLECMKTSMLDGNCERAEDIMAKYIGCKDTLNTVIKEFVSADSLVVHNYFGLI
jgi:CO dehydrogenase/acetyl-CoA synthase gamma subunit (corrinoid Fe-S protein)